METAIYIIAAFVMLPVVLTIGNLLVAAIIVPALIIKDIITAKLKK